MKEPSVLDYVKSIITFWKPSSIRIPSPEVQAQQEVARHEVERQAAAEQPAGDGSVDSVDFSGEPALYGVESAAEPALAGELPHTRASTSGMLLSLGALGMSLIAQALLEPPIRAAVTAG